MRDSRIGRIGAGAVLVAALASGCGGPSGGARAAAVEPLPPPVPAIAGEVLDARGQIVPGSATDATFDDPHHVIGEAKRAVYRSVSGVDGSSTMVSGAFFVPRGTPPAGGWRVISLAHGTTGIDEGCGPSFDADLLGYLPAVLSYLSEHYAVAVTDYQGLGDVGSHPYLEPRTAAFNVTDAVRALGKLFPGVSGRWVAFGNSQGGQAAWAAGEVAGFYDSGLDLVGSVALSPAANITPLADLMRDGALSSEQEAIVPMVVAGLTRYQPELRGRQLAAGASAADLDRSFGCPPNGGGFWSKLLPKKGHSLGDAEVGALREALRRVALPQQPSPVPLLVINGLADETIFPEWTAAAVKDACALGGRIEHVEVTGAGHGGLDDEAYNLASQWVHARFAGTQAPSNCGSPPAVLP